MPASTEHEDRLRPYQLFTLTQLVGRAANQGRTTIVLGSEVRLRTALWFLGSFVASGVIALIAGFVGLGSYALLIPLAVAPAVTFAFTQQSRKGMQLTHMARLFDELDQPWSKGFVIQCDRLYKPGGDRIGRITPASMSLAGDPAPRLDRGAYGVAVESERTRTMLRNRRRAEERRVWTERYEASLRDKMRRAEGGA